MKIFNYKSNLKFTLFTVVCLVIFLVSFITPTTINAQEKIKLVVLGHNVHKTAMLGKGEGKNLVKEFLDSHPNISEVEFITASTSEVGDKLFREVTLSKTSIDIGFVYSPWISPVVTKLFEPIDESSLEEPSDIFETFRKDVTFDGKLYGVPIRVGANCLFYNKKIFKEKGIKEVPKTMEEMIQLAKKLTYTRPNGEKVYGFASIGIKPEIPFTLSCFMRAKNADFMSPNYEIMLTDPRVIEYLNILKELSQAGALGTSFTAQTNSDAVRLFKNNNAAMILKGISYHDNLTGPDGLAKEDVGCINIPPAADYKDKWPILPTKVEQWAIVVPKNSQHKEMAKEFIRFMTSKDATLNMALSGNSPARASVYENPRYREITPYADEGMMALKYGRIIFPGLDNFSEILDIIGEEIQRCVLGQKSAEKAMADAAEKIKPMMPNQ